MHYIKAGISCTISAENVHHFAGLHAPSQRSMCTVSGGVFTPTEEDARRRAERLTEKYEGRFPKAVRILEEGLDDSLAFYGSNGAYSAQNRHVWGCGHFLGPKLPNQDYVYIPRDSFPRATF